MIIIVSDIFGKTPALEKLCYDLTRPFEVVDPYNGEFLKFKTESDAYHHFSEHVGVEYYSELLKYKINNTNEKIILLGFSVGASAIWRISNQDLMNVSSAICFYGSQIRNMLDIQPQIPMYIIPAFEEHFSVQGLSNELAHKRNVKVQGTNYLHGFMNSHSTNYNEAGYKYYIEWMCNKVNLAP